VRNQPLRLDDDGCHPGLGSGFVLLARVLVDGLSRRNRNPLAIRATNPALTFHDDEELVDRRRMAAKDAAGADAEADDVRIAVWKRERQRGRGAAAESPDRMARAAAEVEELHAAASISLRARSN
jgi:hypothetical protein